MIIQRIAFLCLKFLVIYIDYRESYNMYISTWLRAYCTYIAKHYILKVLELLKAGIRNYYCLRNNKLKFISSLIKLNAEARFCFIIFVSLSVIITNLYVYPVYCFALYHKYISNKFTNIIYFKIRV